MELRIKNYELRITNYELTGKRVDKLTSKRFNNLLNIEL